MQGREWSISVQKEKDPKNKKWGKKKSRHVKLFQNCYKKQS